MKKYLITLLSVVMLSSTAAYAGQWGVGVSGSIAAIAADGQESETGNTGTENSVRSSTASNNAIIASIFAEYTADSGMTLGIDYIPGSADVSSKSIKRTDVTADADEAAQDDGDRTAQAEVDNHMTIYAEIPLHNGLFLKGGYVEMDVTGTESSTITTTSSYGTTTADGYVYGLGYRDAFGENGFYRVEATHTAFDSITINSSGDHSITADLDVTQAKFSVGYNF